MTRRYGGTGLGLAISKSLVELMGGDIGMRNRDGGGSTFWFRLPLRPAHGEVTQAIGTVSTSTPEAQRGHGASEHLVNAPPVRPQRVLLAEDNPVNAKLATRLLERLGCRVDLASNGQEALHMVQSIPFDIVFMDCQMPELDGFEATRAIREWERTSPTDSSVAARLPIIALTANAMRGDRERCLEAGMDDYITKPLSRDDLVRALNVWRRENHSVAQSARHASTADEHDESDPQNAEEVRRGSRM